MDNRYGVYRKIRNDRTYRTLGKMSWWRIVLGLALLLSVLLISGTVSQSFALRGHFQTAEALMIAPGWMERYKPEAKALIEAGALYESGDCDGAYEAVTALDAGLLPENARVLYVRLCESLCGYYQETTAEGAETRVQTLRSLLEAAGGGT